jgi:hypothetical protein
LLLQTDVNGVDGIKLSPYQYFMEGNSSSKPDNGLGPSNSSKSVNPSESLSSEELDKMNTDMLNSLSYASDMTTGMRELIKSKNVSVILDEEGNTSLDVPSTMSEEEGNRLAKRLDIMDRVYNTEMEKYKDLSSKDQKLNEGKISEEYNEMYDNISFTHKLNFKK